MQRKSKNCIYLITNKITGKCYVGLTVNLLNRRREHFHIAATSKISPLYNSIRKYGKINFKFTILEENLEKENLARHEIYWIKKLNTLYPNGYNQVKGGEGGDIFNQLSLEKQEQKRAIHRKITLANIEKRIGVTALSQKGKHITELLEPSSVLKWKENYSKSMIECSNRRKRKEYTLKEVQGNRINSEKKLGGGNPRAVKVRCIETEQEFDSIQDIVRLYKLSSNQTIITSINTGNPSSILKLTFSKI